MIFGKYSTKTESLIRSLPDEIVSKIFSFMSNESALLIRQSKFYKKSFPFFLLKHVVSDSVSNSYLRNDIITLNRELFKATVLTILNQELFKAKATVLTISAHINNEIVLDQDDLDLLELIEEVASSSEDEDDSSSEDEDDYDPDWYPPIMIMY